MTDEKTLPVETAEEQPKLAEPQEPEKVEEPFDKDRAMATIKAQREAEKEYKKQLKELEQLKAEKKQREEAELSEAERLKKERDELAADKAKLQADIIRRDVIAETGLPAIFAERLKGETKEEMLADAQELAKTLPTLKVAPKVQPTNPNQANPSETDAQKRERLFGRNSNPFDIDAIKEMGGGVVWNKK